MEAAQGLFTFCKRYNYVIISYTYMARRSISGSFPFPFLTKKQHQTYDKGFSSPSIYILSPDYHKKHFNICIFIAANILKYGINKNNV